MHFFDKNRNDTIEDNGEDAGYTFERTVAALGERLGDRIPRDGGAVGVYAASNVRNSLAEDS